jgi:alpha-beta hydrolase superfamily lysophospholipase
MSTSAPQMPDRPELSRNYHGIIQPVGFPGIPENWITESETYLASDGKTHLFAVTHRRNGLKRESGRKPRILVISHGIGEHGGRYLHFPHYLESNIDVVYCPDHRGHGRSEGLRGHIEQFRDYSDDLAVGILRIENKYQEAFGGAELHVLGHSMGSLIVLDLMVDHADLPLRSVTLSSPLLGISAEVPVAKRVAAVALSRLWGNLQLHTVLNASLLSHDPAVIEAYRKDRLVHDLCTPRLFIEMTGTMKGIAKRIAQHGPAEGIKFPLLMQVPMADKITDPEAALAFFEHLKGGGARVLKTYPGFLHESYNETGKQQPFEDLKAWITRNSTPLTPLSGSSES